MKKLLFGILTLGLLFSSCSKEETRYIRKNANTIDALDDIKAMDKALKIMKEKSCEDPTSWYYQAAIHWVPTRVPNNKLCESYTDWTELKIAWDECTHSHSAAEEINFLIWHRMYIWHFEKIVRKISGDETFALPYWGYTNYDDLDKTMPSMWRDSSSSLFESARLDSLNMGYPIQGAMRKLLIGQYPKLMAITDYQTFNQTLDQSIHGGMHDYIGGGNSHTEKHYNIISQKTTTHGLMGDVPTAAFDPIFWTHHSNIDRIFQKWLSSPNGQKVTLKQLQDNPWKYEFFDENGQLVNYTPEQVLDIVYSMDYDYDDEYVTENLSAEYTEIKVRSIIATASPNIKVTEKKQVVGSIKNPKDYNSPKVMLEIATTFDEIPYGVYEVYLNHPNDAEMDTKLPTYIGGISFFGASHGDPRNKVCLNGCCSPVSEDGKLMTVFNFEVDTREEYVISFHRASDNKNFGLKVNKITLKDYGL
jgi:hypothetical protein